MRQAADVSTRILRLAGLESRNLNTFDRLIYVHGTPANQRDVADGGCIRVSARECWLRPSPGGTEVFILKRPFEDALNLPEFTRAAICDNARASAASHCRVSLTCLRTR